MSKRVRAFRPHPMSYVDPPVDPLAEQARTERFCRGCGGAKEAGPVVCWPCYKHRDDVEPYKYFDGTLTQWLARIDAKRHLRIRATEPTSTACMWCHHLRDDHVFTRTERYCTRCTCRYFAFLKPKLSANRFVGRLRRRKK